MGRQSISYPVVQPDSTAGQPGSTVERPGSTVGQPSSTVEQPARTAGQPTAHRRLPAVLAPTGGYEKKNATWGLHCDRSYGNLFYSFVTMPQFWVTV